MNDINSKSNVIKDFARHEKDTGSSEVQIALLSHRIKYLTEHLGTHRKDKHCQRGLLKLVGTRSSLLKYLTVSKLRRLSTDRVLASLSASFICRRICIRQAVMEKVSHT